MVQAAHYLPVLRQIWQKAKAYITTAIAHALAIGKGVGPTNHFYELYTKAGIWDEIKD